ncbi:uncharacterized protein LOC142582351 isoform X2 [Dermacentor variabilis]
MALLLRAACSSLSLFLCCAVPLALSPSKYAGSMNARTLYNGSVHREKRQLSEIVYALTSGARLIIGAGVGLLQSVGRIGKDVVGESDGGLLGLLSSLFTGVNVSLVLSAFGVADACQPESVDRCVKGVYDSSKGDPAFLPLSTEQLSHFCTRVVEARGCIMRESEGCPDRARSFLEATMEGLKVAYEDLCKNHHLQKSAVYLRTAQCIRQNPASHCMYLYINQLDSIVGSNVTAKMQMACCNMQFYSLCARASITKSCGETAADQVMDLINGMAQAPILASCGNSIPGLEKCRNAPYIAADKVTVPKGTVLSRQLKIILEES